MGTQIEIVNQYSSLHQAAMDCDVNKVKELLKLNTNPNVFKPFDDNDYGGTPLHMVIRMLTFANEEKQIKYLEIAKLLIEHGTLLFEGFGEYRGSTLLQDARFNKRSNIVALMPKLNITFNYLKISFELLYRGSFGPGGSVRITYGKDYFQPHNNNLLYECIYKEFNEKEIISIPELIPVKYEDDGFPSLIKISYGYRGETVDHFIDVVILIDKSEYTYENSVRFVGMGNSYRTFINTIFK